MSRTLDRLGLLPQATLLLALLVASIFAATLSLGQTVVVRMSLREARRVADQVEHVGTWSERYGTVAVHRRGIDPSKAGAYREQRLYATDATEFKRLSGAHAAAALADRHALARLDAYYTKPAERIQREIADLTAEPTGYVRVRIVAVAPDVADAPGAFESEARQAMVSSGVREHIAVQGHQLQYARRLPPTETDFVSVSVAMPSLTEWASHGAPGVGWLPLAGAVAGLAVPLWFVAWRVVLPIERLTRLGEGLARQAPEAASTVPDPVGMHAASSNELHRLEERVRSLSKCVALLSRQMREDP